MSESKNPFVHPVTLPDGRQMLNSVGEDGWSYDEYDDEVQDSISAGSGDGDDGKKDDKYRAHQKALAEQYNHLDVETAKTLTDEQLCEMYDAAMMEKDLECDE